MNSVFYSKLLFRKRLLLCIRYIRLMEKLWEDESFIDDNTLTVNVTRLRKKLEETGIQDYIKTKKGAGYLIE